MVDRRRVDVAKVDIESITNRITDAKEVAHLDNKVEVLKELYDVETETEAQQAVMQDIVLSKMTDVRSLPTAKRTKTEIYTEYCAITGKSRRSAERYFHKVQSKIKDVHNLGMVVHHAAAVAQDVVGKMYDDLNFITKQEKSLAEEIEDYDSNTEDGKKKIRMIEGKLNTLLGRKNKLYEQLLVYAKTFGTDLSVKATQNEINRDKNDILAQKFDNDAQWQKADVFIRHKDMSPAEKRKALSQAISSDKGITETIETAYKDITDE